MVITIKINEELKGGRGASRASTIGCICHWIYTEFKAENGYTQL